MESKKKVGSSSFIDLFGSKEGSSNKSSTGVFASMFQPPSTMPGRRYSSSDSDSIRETWQKHSSRNQEWKTKKETSAAPKSENGVKTYRKENNTSIYQDGKVEPCHLSSSLYYGGQDVYSHSSSTQNYGSSSYPSYEKNGQEGDSNGGHTSPSASRGNWWEGSLYY